MTHFCCPLEWHWKAIAALLFCLFLWGIFLAQHVLKCV